MKKKKILKNNFKDFVQSSIFMNEILTSSAF